MKVLSRFALASLLAMSMGGSALAAEQQFISIGTGGVTGVYYPTGGAICRLINKGRKDHGIRCSSESTGGSVYNINTLRAGELEFGIAQSDWQFHAYRGTSKFEDNGKFPELRAVFSIAAEPVTIIARDESNIMNLPDVKGKRFNIGNPGSGTLATWEVVESSLGWKRSDLALAAGMKSSEMGAGLCDDKFDAFFFLVGHPSAVVTETIASCSSHLVEAKGPLISKLIKDNPYYGKITIPAGMYNNEKGIESFGVLATLNTTTAVSNEVVYTLVKAVFENFDDFKKLHPAFNDLTEKGMIADGISIPLHDGAIKYYKEKGWM
ncbi:TAXI family TRAP transporter solute-binding subunit [Gammaproteobacteria bacterium]|nr:TAXI family TRAP transporter solute-binding subunit [Gammaproteobacteria bacterium]